MKIKTRILSGFFVIIAVVIYFWVDFVTHEVRPRYLETVEESLNDTVNILASLLELDIKNNSIKFQNLDSIFKRALKKRFSAKIYALLKTNVTLHVYVTDKNGIVLYDSNDGEYEGKNFSKWNDVHRSLKGKYGARSTRIDEDDPFTNHLYVSAPVKYNNEIIGVITVVKPELSVTSFIELARRKIIFIGVLGCMAFFFLSFILSIWISRPVMKLTEYVKSLKNNNRPKMPVLKGSEIKKLGTAFEDMWTELKGKKYIEQYIQTLTHELKSPLSSIRGSAELLEEGMPDEQKEKFYHNILTESQRIESVINKLLQLSSIESRKELKDIEEINIYQLILKIIKSLSPQIIKKQITVTNNVNKSSSIEGEKFLIRHAVINLLQNSVQFTSNNGEIVISSKTNESVISIAICDNGEGIPSYAVDKIFNRFYSLPGKNSKTKGTGLGLSFVEEVASLHGGSVSVENNETAGVTANLILPIKQM